MFGFKKKKPKIDPKIRFQNRQFNQKLQQARTFKRSVRPVPDSNFDKFLARIGLGSRLLQAVIVLVALGILYIVYAPNFLTVGNITVEGLKDADREVVERTLRDSIASAKFFDPQTNLLFLSKQRLTDAALSVPAVNNIDRIIKNFSDRSVKVIVQAKHERFLVRTANNVLDVYNDGTVKGIAGLSRESWDTTINPGMAKFEVPGIIKNTDTKEFVSPQTAQYLIELQETLKAISGTNFAYYSLVLPETRPKPAIEPTIEEQLAEIATDSEQDQPAEDGSTEEPVEEPIAEPEEVREFSLPLNPEELYLVMQKGTQWERTFRVIIDTKENPRDLVLRLSLLLSQTAPERYNALSYIDLRLKERAFVCLQNAPCDK